MNPEIILRVKNLHTRFELGKQKFITAVNGISLHLFRGEILGIVGESGSGKSVTARSILRLLPNNAVMKADAIVLNGENVQLMSANDFRKTCGGKFSMIFQEPLTALNPSFTIGWQIREVYNLHQKSLSNTELQRKTLEMLRRVKIPDPEKREKEYPYQLSGGMRQRGLISIALASEPEILIADEPTTALDVTVQADIMDLIEELRSDFNLSVILISHSLNLIVQRCDRVMVMYAGQVMEEASSERILKNPLHPYTIGLMKSIPDINNPDAPLVSIPGDIADLQNQYQGCPFASRCEKTMPICERKRPEWIQIEPEHWCACYLYIKEAGDSFG